MYQTLYSTQRRKSDILKDDFLAKYVAVVAEGKMRMCRFYICKMGMLLRMKSRILPTHANLKRDTQPYNTAV